MCSDHTKNVLVEDVQISGHSHPISVRSYRTSVATPRQLPIVLYFHGGLFTSGSVSDATHACTYLAIHTPAWVVSVDYSLAPQFPFPNALEDGFKALQWVLSEASSVRADKHRIAIAGEDAGGNIATCVSALARDRGTGALKAQVLLAPTLDPSLTHLATPDDPTSPSIDFLSDAYRAYLPTFMQRVHPYAAPLESQRLQDLPPAYIVSVEGDAFRLEAERYASLLIASGVPTESVRAAGPTRKTLTGDDRILRGASDFLRRRFEREGGTATVLK